MTKIFTKYKKKDINIDTDNQFINIVTCTYPRPYRINYLSHLKKILIGIPKIRWIVVDDNDHKDPELIEFLPDFAILLNYGPTKDKGNAQRNYAWEYIYDNKLDGIIYNADDDNVYDKQLFNEIRKTIKFGIMPVGNLSTRDGQTERPILDKNGRFKGWNSYWQRKYSTDMAGFCFHSSVLNKIKKPFWSHKGFAGETEFISKILQSPHDMEFLCNNCTETYVWHNLLLDSIEVKSERIIDFETKTIGSRFGRTVGDNEQYQEIKNKIFNNEIDDTAISEIESIFNSTEGVCDSPDRSELCMLTKLLIDLPDGDIVEIGCWRGRTTCILSKFKKSSHNLFVVDNFESENGLDYKPNSKPNNLNKFHKTIDSHNLQNTFTLIDSDSTKIQWSSYLKKRSIKLIFYDGDSSFINMKKTILNMIPYMHTECKIIFHDASWRDTQTMINHLCNKYKFNIKTYMNIWEGLAILAK